MFSKKKQPSIRSLIAEGCHVHGDLSFSEGLRIDGSVAGKVISGSGEFGKQKTLVFISQTGRISGGVQADIVIVNGSVEGPIQANHLLELQPKARVHGDVSYKQLEMHPGALIAGRMLPLEAVAADVVAKPAAAIEGGRSVVEVLRAEKPKQQ